MAEKRPRGRPKKPVIAYDPPEHTTAQMAKFADRKPEDTIWYPWFLNALRRKPNVSAACREARVGRRTAYVHREKNPEFAKDWDDAFQEGLDVIEEAHWLAGMNGDVKSREYLLQKHRYGGVAPGAKKPEEEAKPTEVVVRLGKRAK